MSQHSTPGREDPDQELGLTPTCMIGDSPEEEAVDQVQAPLVRENDPTPRPPVQVGQVGVQPGEEGITETTDPAPALEQGADPDGKDPSAGTAGEPSEQTGAERDQEEQGDGGRRGLEHPSLNFPSPTLEEEEAMEAVMERARREAREAVEERTKGEAREAQRREEAHVAAENMVEIHHHFGSRMPFGMPRMCRTPLASRNILAGVRSALL